MSVTIFTSFESCFKVTSTFSTLTVLLKCIWVNANYMSTALQKELRHCPVWLPYINLLDQYQYQYPLGGATWRRVSRPSAAR